MRYNRSQRPHELLPDILIFGIPAQYPIAILVISLVLCIVLITACAFFYCKNIRLFSNPGKRIITLWGKIKGSLAKIRKQGKGKKIRGKLLPLGIYELKKSRALISLAVIAILILARGEYVSRTVGTMESYGQAIYYEYIAEIQPLDDASRAIYISEERARIDAIVSVAEAKKTAFEHGKIEPAEYFEYLEILAEAKSKDRVFEDIEDYVKYIDNKNTATGLDGKIIYSMGYEKFFALSSDIFICRADNFMCKLLYC